MRRRQLFEFEDQPWLPTSIRDYMTDFLHVIFARLSARVALEEPIALLLAKGHTDRIVDLASGGGGPVLALRRRIERVVGHRVHIVMTDRYPNTKALDRIGLTADDGTVYHPRSIDARAIPDELEGVRTVFTAFHHFRPEQARLILADAASSRQPIGVFESTERSAKMLLVTCLVPLLVAITTLFIRPWRLRRLVLTFLLPVIPLLSLWDGLVSCLRTYSLDELDEMAAGVSGEDWSWESGHLPVAGLPFQVTYLLGYPTGKESSSDP